MEVERSATNTSALHVFPVELWEIIIENMDDSEAIEATLEAFPELTHLSCGKEFSWLPGQVVWLLIHKYLDTKHILTCRLVSKRYRSAIVSCLETNPCRIPYNSRRVAKMTETHVNYDSRRNQVFSLQKFMNNSEFYSIDWNFPLGNPVFGRYLYIDMTLNEELEFAQVIRFLEKFGHEIWYLKFECWHVPEVLVHEESTANQVVQLQKCLSLLVNLRSLELVNHSKHKINFNDFSIAPVLMHLETFDISQTFGLETFAPDLPERLVGIFVNHDNVQKFGISLDDWREAFGSMFPNLTELCIRYTVIFNITKEVTRRVKRILSNLQSPKLRKITFEIHDANVNDYLETVAPYNIESLELVGCHLTEDKDTPQIAPLITIKNLKLNATEKIRFNFLKLLPSLEYLTLCQEVDEDWDYEVEGEMPFKVALKNFYLPNNRTNWKHFQCIWEICPNLKVLTLRENNNNSIEVQYVRECRSNFGQRA